MEVDLLDPLSPLTGPCAGEDPAPVLWPERGSAWRILVVESDGGEAEDLARGLRRHGHQVQCVTTGCAAIDGCADADLVLLGFELPDLDGLGVLRAIRAGSDVPVIALTGRGSELDCVLGLQAGADDYLVKPRGFRELMARIEAVMRRARPAPDPGPGEVISRGALRIDPCTREVSVYGQRVEVTRKEFDLLHLLAANPETVVPRKQLIQEVWGDSWSRRTVDTHVSSLRGKLGASSWVITVRGVGFRIGHG